LTIKAKATLLAGLGSTEASAVKFG